MPSFDFDGTMCFAHRGFSDQYPENTLPAFQAALDADCEGIELDVCLTADGRLAVMHDETLDRTTTGTGKVSERKVIDLACLDAGSWFDPKFFATPVPLLEDVFDLVGGKMLINVEIKPEAAAPVEELVANLVRKRGLEGSVLISSFNFQTLLRLRSYAPEIRLGILCFGDEAHVGHLDLARAIDAYSLHVHLERAPESLIREAKSDGRKVYTWVFQGHNGRDAIERALDLGVDGYFANDPEFFLELRD